MKKVICIIIALVFLMSTNMAFAKNYKGNNGRGKSNSKHSSNSNYVKEIKKLKDLLKKYVEYEKDDEDEDEDIDEKIDEIIDEILDLKDEYNDESDIVFINGVEYSCSQEPIIRHGNIQLPTKPVTEGLGAKVDWNSKTKTVTITKGNITLAMKLDKKTITINGIEVKSDVLKSSKNGNTILLIEFIAQVLGYNAEVDEDSSVVIIDDEDSTSINDNITGKGLNQFDYRGKWVYALKSGAFLDDVHYSTNKNAYFNVRFSGSKIKLYGSTASNYGIAAVSIDGGSEVKVDFYSKRSANDVLLYTSPTLSSGQHTLKIRVTGTRNKKSGNTAVVVDRVVVPEDGNMPQASNLALNKNVLCDSVQTENTAAKGNDGNTATRWCAADDSVNHWWTVDLGNNYNISGTEVIWEKSNKIYKYKVEVSSDNYNWTLKVDKTNNSSIQQTQTDSFNANSARFVRITVTGLEPGCWASFYEFRVFGTGIDTQAPTTPATLTATAHASSEVDLNWSASTDNVGVTGYKIYRNGTHIATVTSGTSYRDRGLSAGTVYVYSVCAYDVVGNNSSQSSAVAVTTPLSNGSGTGLLGDYFNNKDLSDLKASRVDNTINFDWNNNSPYTNMGSDTFSVRWTGQIQPLFTEDYTFYTKSDDGVRLWVNGQKLIDNWTEHGSTENSGRIALTAGQKYDVKLEYYDNTGEAEIKLSWSSKSQQKQIVPQTQLYPAALDTRAPTAPAALTASLITTDKAYLYWTASTDNTGVAGYKIYRNGNYLASVSNGTTYTDAGLMAGTAYVYAISAYDAAGNISNQSTPAIVTTASNNGNGTGLKGEYYNNIDFTELKVAQVDSSVNFDWGNNAPHSAMNSDTFSVRWTGQIQPLYTENYTFHTNSDDGIRLWINGQKVIDNWTDHSLTENTGTISLTAGQKYEIKTEYYDKGGDAVIKLHWSSPSQTKQIVPKSQLYPSEIDTQAPSVPSGLTASAVSSTQINLRWNSSTDNAGIAGYKIYRNGTHIGTVTSGTSYSDGGLTANTTYVYTILAFDASGNSSAQSAPIVAATQQSSVINVALNKAASADSQEAANPAYKGNDGSTSTRWCAADGSFNHWWKADLGELYNITGSEITWELSGKVYKYKIEVSQDDRNWTLVLDRTNNTSTLQTQAEGFTANSARYVRITVTGFDSGCWASFSEFKIFGSVA